MENFTLQTWLIIGAGLSIVWAWLMNWVKRADDEPKLPGLKPWQAIVLFYIGYVLFLGLIVLIDNMFIRQ